MITDLFVADDLLEDPAALQVVVQLAVDRHAARLGRKRVDDAHVVRAPGPPGMTLLHAEWKAVPSGEPSEATRLSKLLFEARELIDMFGDVTRDPGWPRRVRDEIDAFRAEEGWSPHGFGGEKPRPLRPGTHFCACGRKFEMHR